MAAVRASADDTAVSATTRSCVCGGRVKGARTGPFVCKRGERCDMQGVNRSRSGAVRLQAGREV
eukprot:353366-Chlamydomonas_euryale.AAC.4